jgi:hypothetical protein
VVLVTVALQGQKADKLLETLEELALLPITSEDVIRVAANAFTDKVRTARLGPPDCAR